MIRRFDPSSVAKTPRFSPTQELLALDPQSSGLRTSLGGRVPVDLHAHAR